MGNQIAGLTPPPLVNVEDCLSDMTNTVRFEEELSGSRLFKVAKAKRIDDGSSQLLLIKVFSNPNALQIFSLYLPLVEAYCRQIPGGYNLLSFTVNVAQSERNIVWKRDFIDQSLVDRLCTRPFLCLEEKKWIAFQLLCALAQLHRTTISVPAEKDVACGDPVTKRVNSVQPLCHGDIKGENVLLTSWGWLLLTDPAPFKPCQLPIDNPSEFTRYFDSSRRRVCYLAPERFVHIKRPSVFSAGDRLAFGMPSTTHASHLRGDGAQQLVSESNPGSETRDTPIPTEQTTEASTGPSLQAASVTDPAIGTETTSVPIYGMYRDSSEPPDASQDTQPGFNTATVWSQPQLVLDPAMDLFSAGCVLLELFTDGSVVFTLADLLNYRCGAQSRLSNLLNQVSCEEAKQLIVSLLSLDPKARGSADGHLEAHRGKVFPEVFYTHLMPYMQSFLSSSLANPTIRMSYLRQTLPLFLKDIDRFGPKALQICSVLIANIVAAALKPVVSSYINQTPSTAAAVGSTKKVNASIAVHQPYSSASRQHPVPEVSFTPTDRYLFESGKVDALICLLELHEHIPPGLLLDRVIPYCVDLTSIAHSPEVRSLALDCLAQILHHVTQLPLSSTSGSTSLEAFFLTEYLFPTLASLSVDPKSEIRLAYARCLPTLAESALRFLNSSSQQLQRSRLDSDKLDGKDQTKVEDLDRPLQSIIASESFDTHLSLLRRHIQDRFSDLDRQVRYALMSTRGLINLAKFFGRSPSCGTLLSHMITFLNDKGDAGLRASFYRLISPLTILVGAQSIGVIHPLLEQGLIDPNEMVVESCVQALTHLLRLSLLSAPLAVSFLSGALALTSHPTARLRQSAVAYITCFARRAVKSTNPPARTSTTSVGDSVDPNKPKLGLKWSGLYSPASVYARLANSDVAETFFRYPIRNCFTSDLVLLSSLRRPIPRIVIETLVCLNQSQGSTKSMDIPKELFQYLQERKASRAVTRPGENPCYTSPNNEVVAHLFAKIQSLGLTETMEAQLLSLSPLLLNICESHWDRPAISNNNNTSISTKQKRACVPTPQTRLIDVEQFGAPSLPRQRRNLIPLNSWSDLPFSAPVTWSLTGLLQSAIVEYEQTLRDQLRSGSIPMNNQHASDPTFPDRRLFGRGLSWRTTATTSSSNTLLLPDPGTQLVDQGAELGPTPSGTLRRSTIVGRGTYGPSDTVTMNRNQSAVDLRHTTHGSLESVPAQFSPQGILVAHLHEHRAGVISLAVHGSGRLMASCSSGDGTVKLWNCGLWPVDADTYLNQTFHSTQTVTSDQGSKTGSGTKPAGFSQIFSLPTRSSWTYSTRGDSADGSVSTTCRGLVWTAGGSQVATISQGEWIHCVDVATGRQCGLNSLARSEHGRALCLTVSASCQFPAQLSLLRSGLSNGGDANLVAYATTGNFIVARDLRIPFSSPPAWCLQQDRAYGLLRSMAMHSCYTWFVTGTARGYLVSWDLRYKRPIACTQHPGHRTPVALLNLQLVETPSMCTISTHKQRPYSVDDESQDLRNKTEKTLIFAATDYNNGVIVWDLESCASASSAAVTIGSQNNNARYPNHVPPVVRAGQIASAWSASEDYTPVRSILCLPWSKSTSSTTASTAPNMKGPSTDIGSFRLPSVIAGGKDGRLRSWNFSSPRESRVLVWSGEEESSPPNLTYREMSTHGTRSLIEEANKTTLQSVGVLGSVQTKHGGLTTITQPRSGNANTGRGESGATQPVVSMHPATFPMEGRLDLREPSVGHRNIVSDISLIRAAQYFLVSASMDGVIKIWR